MVTQNKKKLSSNAESGSAILWILVAVSLFAALNYAFSSGSRNSTSSLDDAEATAYANQIIQYGNEVKSAVKRLTLRGCSDTEISFENNVLENYTNPNSPVDKSCHVFDIAGGGLSYAPPVNTFKGPSENFYTSVINGITVTNAGENCANSTCTELVLVIRLSSNASSNIDIQNAKKLCETLNKKLSNNPLTTDLIWGDDTPTNSAHHRFKGTYLTDLTIDEPIIYGKTSYCGKVNASIYSFQKILIAR